MTREAREQLQQWAMKYPVVATVLTNLAGNEMVRDILVEHIERDQEFQEREFMEAFFAAWLARDTRSDDRPSRLKPEHLDHYLRLLQSIAVKYAQPHRMDDQGYFEVAEEDDVVLEGASVSVRRVLNRSGLVNVDAKAPHSSRFRFEPFWFHRLLVQMHNDQRDRDATRTVTAGYKRQTPTVQ